MKTTSSVTGSITNSGTVTGNLTGIRIDDSGVGGITNQAGGTITGATFFIQINNPDAPITITNAGFLDGEVQLNNGTLDLNGSSSRVDGVTYDVLAGDDQVTATFEGGGSAFVTESLDPAPFGVTAGVALDLIPETGIDATLAYDIEAREDFRNHKVQLNLRFPF